MPDLLEEHPLRMRTGRSVWFRRCSVVKGKIMTDRKKRSVAKRLGLLEEVELTHTKLILELRQVVEAILEIIPNQTDRQEIMRLAGERLENLINKKT